MPKGIYQHQPCSEETKRKISDAQKGEKGYWYGKEFSGVTIKKMSISHKGIPNHQKGHVLSEETKRKISISNKGKIISEETKRKMSIADKGRIHTQETKNKISKALKGEKSYWFGKQLSLETKQKISKANKGNVGYWTGKYKSEETKKKLSESQRGKKGSNWKGGKSFEPYTIQFNKQLKELIRNRDNYKCQLCGMPECENVQKLCIHHIDYDKKNCLPSNLISLCRKCHTKTNYKREYWIKYFGTLKEEE